MSLKKAKLDNSQNYRVANRNVGQGQRVCKERTKESLGVCG